MPQTQDYTTVNVPIGSETLNLRFPKGMSQAQMQQAIESNPRVVEYKKNLPKPNPAAQSGAIQQKPGGPIYNTQTNPPPESTEKERALQWGPGGPMFVDVPKGHKASFESANRAGYAEGGKTGAEILGSMAGGEAALGLKGITGIIARILASGTGAGLGSLAGQAAFTNKKVSGKEAIKTGAEYGIGEGIFGELAPELLSKSGDVLQRVNKMIGVGKGEIRVGTSPASMAEFAGNPARGVLNAGLTEKQLAKMTPLERLDAIVDVRETAGKALDKTLQAAAGKTVDIGSTVKSTFGEILDPRLKKQAMNRFNQILFKNNLATKPLSQFTPMEVRVVQRALDDFAKFVPEGQLKSFSDVAAKLRRGFSDATIKVVPEAKILDQNYGDLAAATKAARNSAGKFARTVPPNELKKWLVRSLAVGGAGSAAYEIYKGITQ